VTSAVVIFGCAVLRNGEPSSMLRRRVDAAYAFERERPLYVPTGGVGRHGPSEARVMARLLRERGVSEDRIILEETGTDTLSSARAVTRLLRGHLGPVYVASSGFHQPRCVMLLRLASLDARRSPPPPPAANAFQRWYWRVRELPAIPYDALLMLTGRR
jgi:vancomycin permeability regulator SanA